MIKARIILGILAAAIVGLQFPLANLNLPDKWNYATEGASVVLFVAAVSIIIFSFFRVHETLTGDLCFDGSNPLWKLMLFFESTEERPLKSMSLCGTYWLTVLAIVLASFVIALVSFFAAVVIPDLWHAFMEDPKTALKTIGIIVVCLIALAVITFAIATLCQKYPRFGKVFAITALAGVIGFVLFVATVLPVMDIQTKRHISTPAAIEIYLHYAAYTVSALAIAILLIFAAFKYVPILKNTWLGRIFGMLKKNFCPQLMACNHASEEAAG